MLLLRAPEEYVKLSRTEQLPRISLNFIKLLSRQILITGLHALNSPSPPLFILPLFFFQMVDISATLGALLVGGIVASM